MGVSKRNINIDCIKVIASCCVLCVHFLKNSGFYEASLHGWWGFISVFMRTAFMVCVPLFLMITGYLMAGKKVTSQHYLGLIRVITVYVVASTACIMWKSVYFGHEIGFTDYVEQILGFSGCTYSWYVEMYIGLFLIIPFLNVLYDALDRSGRVILLLSLCIMVSLPPVVNYRIQILPSWWSDALFPLLYYYLGRAARDFNLNISKLACAVALIAWILFSSIFNYLLCIETESNEFGWPIYTDWGSLQNAVSTFLLFHLVLKANFRCSDGWVGRGIEFMAQRSLAIYLTSWLVDKTLYPILRAELGSFESILPYFVPITLVTTFISIVLSSIVQAISSPLSNAIVNVVQRDG